jgi:hypothetical protein
MTEAIDRLREPGGSAPLGPSPLTYGVSSDLSGAALAGALALWSRLGERLGLAEARAALAPHVSYLVGESDRPEDLLRALAPMAATIEPIPVEITGPRVFDGPPPVLYLAVERSDALRAAHARILEATRHLWSRIWPHYTSAAWTPHVTLALRDLAPERLSEVLDDVGGQSTRFWSVLLTVDLVHVILPRHAYLTRIPLGSGSRAAGSLPASR